MFLSDLGATWALQYESCFGYRWLKDFRELERGRLGVSKRGARMASIAKNSFSQKACFDDVGSVFAGCSGALGAFEFFAGLNFNVDFAGLVDQELCSRADFVNQS